MCVVSAINDYGREKWPGVVVPWPDLTTAPLTPQPAFPPFKPKEPDGSRLPSKAEIESFLELIKRAQEFDRVANQPHCEDPEKVKFQQAMEQRLVMLEQQSRTIADHLGIQPRHDLRDDHEPFLYGSNVLAATYLIGGRTVQLGDIVRRAYEDHVRAGEISSASEWNELTELKREHLLVNALYDLRREAR